MDIISGLNREKFHPILLCPKSGELTDFVARQDVEVTISRWRSIDKSNPHLFLKDVVNFWRFLKKEKIQLLHLNEIGWRDSLVLAAWLRQIPVILHLHVNYDGPLTTNWNFRFASSVFVVADTLKNGFIRTPQIYKKLITVHNGLSVEQFSNGHEIRISLGLTKKDKVIGFVGQLVAAKGLKVLVTAAKAVLEVHPDTVFLFVGRRVASEEGFVDELMQLAAQQNIAHAMRFLAPRNDIPDVMKSLDIMVLPTLGEAFPKVILEALGSRIPVVASAVGGIPEIIEDGVNGLLVPPGDVPALEKALIDLLNCPEKRQKLAEAGFSTVQEKFTVQRQIAKIETVYDRLLGQ